MSLGVVVDIIHLFLLFIPFILLFIPKTVLTRYILSIKIMFLLFILVPVHWLICNNQCLLTEFSKKNGTLSNTSNAFSKQYLGLIYYTIIDSVGAKRNDNNLDKVIGLHWMIILILFWYIVMFRLN